jgi:hypothetical protein
MSIDWNHVGLLLHIVDKAKDHPKLVHLTNAALAALDNHAVEAKKANDLAAKEKADKIAAEAMKHVEEVKQSEADRLAKEEEDLKKRPPGKTPAELQAEAEASRAANEAAKAASNVEGEKQPEPIRRRSLTGEPVNE